MKMLATAAAATLLAPGAAVLGVATLVTPSATGSARCIWGQQASSVEVAGIPDSLRAINAHGASVVLSREQLTRAATVIAVGQSQRVPARAQLIAVMTALTESTLRVLSNTTAYPSSSGVPNDGDGGDHDSVGLFQQRPQAGWGSVANLMDPVWSSRSFYGGAGGPNRASPRGLLDIDGWQTMEPGAAAQAVQVSAYPARYAVNQPVAEEVLAALGGVAVTSPTGCADLNATKPPSGSTSLPPGFARDLIATAAAQLGKPYVWGGGNFSGPTGGGFDCSGLVLYAAYQASGGRIRLPHYTGDQIRLGHPVAWDDKQPGDLVFFSYPGAGRPHHMGIFVGGDRILHAPHTGDVVRYGALGDFTGDVMTVRRLN